ncbi:hypothetical protein C8R45DRAFT_1024472 [Mycena sanguinolenta]|nr:hypothetical protein C8R45DRAFT_1024472 [Mycena sanguinolenta]
MPSSSITIALCFLAFASGELFHAVCTRIAHPVIHVNIETVAAAAPVDTGFPFAELLWIVLSVFLVHDLVIIAVVAHLFKDQKGSIKRLQAEVGSFFKPRRSRPLLLPSSTSSASPIFLKRRSRWPIVIPWCPTSHFLPPAHVELVVLPLIESPLALALVTTRASTRLPPITFAAGRRFGLQYFKTTIPFIRLYGLAKGSGPTERGGNTRLALKICDTEREGEVEAKIKDTVPEASIHDQDVPINTCPSQSHFLRRVAAAALLRRLTFKVDGAANANPEHQVVEMVPTQKVETVEERVVEEVKDKQIVEEIEGVGDIDAGKEEAKADEASGADDEVAKKVELEGLPSYEDIVNEVPPGSFYEVGVRLHGELECLPSYEEFANGVPPETLFEKRPAHVAAYDVHRPPPLSYLASRTGAIPKVPRASHHDLLARLRIRISGSVAEPPAVLSTSSTILAPLRTQLEQEADGRLVVGSGTPELTTSLAIAAANGVSNSTWTHVHSLADAISPLV